MYKEPYPLLLEPCYMNYLWGGDRIIKSFQRSVNISPCAESWEASDRLEGPNIILNGSLKNLTLSDALKKCPSFFFQNDARQLPFLIKLIDAQKALSIQVHPCEKKAAFLEGQPKTEAWHILDAEPGSFIYLGLKKKLTLDELDKAIKNQNLEQYLHQIEVKPGQTFYIPAGVIHSIGAGCLIYEVQQNSNTTYRLYDWNRVNAAGEKRPLHIEKGLNALRENQGPFTDLREEKILTQEGVKNKLISSPYFELFHWAFSHTREVLSSSQLRHFFISEGSCSLVYSSEKITLTKGQSLLIPSKCKPFFLMPVEKTCELIEVVA